MDDAVKLRAEDAAKAEASSKDLLKYRRLIG
jgi:hypothetical protein